MRARGQLAKVIIVWRGEAFEMFVPRAVVKSKVAGFHAFLLALSSRRSSSRTRVIFAPLLMFHRFPARLVFVILSVAIYFYSLVVTLVRVVFFRLSSEL